MSAAQKKLTWCRLPTRTMCSNYLRCGSRDISTTRNRHGKYRWRKINMGKYAVRYTLPLQGSRLATDCREIMFRDCNGNMSTDGLTHGWLGRMRCWCHVSSTTSFETMQGPKLEDQLFNDVLCERAETFWKRPSSKAETFWKRPLKF